MCCHLPCSQVNIIFKLKTCCERHPQEHFFTRVVENFNLLISANPRTYDGNMGHQTSLEPVGDPYNRSAGTWFRESPYDHVKIFRSHRCVQCCACFNQIILDVYIFEFSKFQCHSVSYTRHLRRIITYHVSSFLQKLHIYPCSESAWIEPNFKSIKRYGFFPVQHQDLTEASHGRSFLGASQL